MTDNMWMYSADNYTYDDNAVFYFDVIRYVCTWNEWQRIPNLFTRTRRNGAKKIIKLNKWLQNYRFDTTHLYGGMLAILLNAIIIWFWLIASECSAYTNARISWVFFPSSLFFSYYRLFVLQWNAISVSDSIYRVSVPLFPSYQPFHSYALFIHLCFFCVFICVIYACVVCGCKENVSEPRLCPDQLICVVTLVKSNKKLSAG